MVLSIPPSTRRSSSPERLLEISRIKCRNMDRGITMAFSMSPRVVRASFRGIHIDVGFITCELEYQQVTYHSAVFKLGLPLTRADCESNIGEGKKPPQADLLGTTNASAKYHRLISTYPPSRAKSHIYQNPYSFR